MSVKTPFLFQEGLNWHAIKSHVRLIHVTTGYAMRFTGRQLPAWGYNQHEVAADKTINHHDTIWNVEEHRYTKSRNHKVLFRLKYPINQCYQIVI